MSSGGGVGADPHPGNLIRTPDGRLAILDFGLMTQVDDEIKFGMIEAISHLIHRDYEAIVEDFVTLQFIPKGTDLRYAPSSGPPAPGPAPLLRTCMHAPHRTHCSPMCEHVSIPAPRLGTRRCAQVSTRSTQPQSLRVRRGGARSKWPAATGASRCGSNTE